MRNLSRQMTSDLAARRGVDYCSRLMRNPRLSSLDAIEEAKSNRSEAIQAAGKQLELMRSQLRKDVLHFLQTGEQSGFLKQFPSEKLAKIVEKENHIRFQDLPDPSPSHPIPTLDMSRLRIESPPHSERVESARTPVVSDIPSFEEVEVVEVSDSSAYDSQIFNTMADKLLQKVEEKKKNGPQIQAKISGMTRSQNVDFSKLPLAFIPSSPLRKPSTSAEIGVQTHRTLMESDAKVDAATSYSSQHFQDIGEISTSEENSSDPSLGQIDQMRVHPGKVISVKTDGSLSLRPKISEIEWKPPLDLIRIAEKDISSSFGSEIETVSARKPMNSDEELTVNQFSLLESDASE